MRIDTWWTANRLAAPDLFQRELEATVSSAANSPKLGAVSAADCELPDYGAFS